MNNTDKKNLQTLNEIWKSGALEDFIRRMLVYFDPLDVIVLGAPHDEYDADIPKIKNMVLQKEITTKQLSELIFNLYNSNERNVDDVKKKSLRMAEDLIELKNS
jgi:hypothetical protein